MGVEGSHILFFDTVDFAMYYSLRFECFQLNLENLSRRVRALRPLDTPFRLPRRRRAAFHAYNRLKWILAAAQT